MLGHFGWANTDFNQTHFKQTKKKYKTLSITTTI